MVVCVALKYQIVLLLFALFQTIIVFVGSLTDCLASWLAGLFVYLFRLLASQFTLMCDEF